MSTPDAKQIPALYQKALGLQNKGQLNKALQLYQKIAAANPHVPEVHFQVGRIFASVGKHAKALRHLREAARLKPKEPAIWHMWGQTVLSLGDPQATEAFAKALQGAPLPASVRAKITGLTTPAAAGDDIAGGAPRAELTALDQALAEQRFDDAEAGARALSKAHPESAAAVLALARAQAARGEINRAAKSFGKAVELAPGAAAPREALGRFLMDHNRLVEAVEELRRGVTLDPGLGSVKSALGRALTRLEQHDEAEEVLTAAIAADPGLAEAQANLGTLLVTRSRDEEAVAAYEKAIALGDETPQTHAFLARALGVLNREDAALDHFAKAIEIDPTYAFAYARRASLLQTQGDFAGAEADFRRALDLDPTTGETYRVFAASHKFSADDPLIATMQARIEDPGLSETDRMNLGFALSKAMEDAGRYDQVFRYLHPANAAMRKAYPYDVADRAKEVAKLKSAFIGADYSDANAVTEQEFAPIFVTGMPRSGTTLVEQILASHSTATGAGEVGEFSRQAYGLIARPTGPFQPVSGLSHDQLRTLGQDYADYMRARFPGADRITDKSIQTYSFIGLVRLALPRARVVVVRRDPRDNLLSIYKNVFMEGTHRYAYNLSDLAAYYRLFEDMVAFWRKTLPGGFYEIQYDELTANPEAEARKLLAACDLEWEDACLNFHQNTRRVDTLSVYQVRQPIYRSSVKSWQRYEDDLGELLDALK